MWIRKGFLGFWGFDAVILCAAFCAPRIVRRARWSGRRDAQKCCRHVNIREILWRKPMTNNRCFAIARSNGEIGKDNYIAHCLQHNLIFKPLNPVQGWIHSNIGVWVAAEHVFSSLWNSCGPSRECECDCMMVTHRWLIIRPICIVSHIFT